MLQDLSSVKGLWCSLNCLEAAFKKHAQSSYQINLFPGLKAGTGIVHQAKSPKTNIKLEILNHILTLSNLAGCVNVHVPSVLAYSIWFCLLSTLYVHPLVNPPIVPKYVECIQPEREKRFCIKLKSSCRKE